MIADWMSSVGLGGLKPVLSALALPPVPLLALALVGACVTRSRPRTAGTLVVLACVGLWLCTCSGFARWLERHGLDEPAPLASADRARLSYAVWLQHETGIPILASGGRGWGAPDPSNPPEASRTAELAQAELGTTLRWTETASRDTHENAVDSVALLRAAGVREIVLVTHGWHMPRALHEFRAAAAAAAGASAPLRITAATMGQAYPAGPALLRWMPSDTGFQRTRLTWHEMLGALVDHR
jgi:uncharacterized SAM-binding protein YcdF (DUF218 family)